MGSLSREAGTAAAGAGRVRVFDHKLRAFQIVFVVNLRAHQVLVAQRVKQQRHTILGHGGVVVVGDFVKREAIRET